MSFEGLFSLKPLNRGVVKVFNKATGVLEDKEIFRSYANYGVIPELNESNNKSYMFVERGLQNQQEGELLSGLVSELLSLARTVYPLMNQCSVNWYEPSDYIELHSDCTKGFVYQDHPILMLNLSEIDCDRFLTFVCKSTGNVTHVPLKNGGWCSIKNNLTHRHSVGTGEGRRVSFTFRAMKDMGTNYEFTV